MRNQPQEEQADATRTARTSHASLLKPDKKSTNITTDYCGDSSSVQSRDWFLPLASQRQFHSVFARSTMIRSSHDDEECREAATNHARFPKRTIREADYRVRKVSPVVLLLLLFVLLSDSSTTTMNQAKTWSTSRCGSWRKRAKTMQPVDCTTI